MPRERYDLAFSIVLGMGDHQAMKDLVDEVLANALNNLVENRAIEEWQVSADSVDLTQEEQLQDLSDQIIAEVIDDERRERCEEPLSPADPAPEVPREDPRTEKDEPGQ